MAGALTCRVSTRSWLAAAPLAPAGPGQEIPLRRRKAQCGKVKHAIAMEVDARKAKTSGQSALALSPDDAMFLTRVHNRLIRNGKAQLVDPSTSSTGAAARSSPRLRHRTFDQSCSSHAGWRGHHRSAVHQQQDLSAIATKPGPALGGIATVPIVVPPKIRTRAGRFRPFPPLLRKRSLAWSAA
jgi:hypothetical protein